ncbi:NlpC/P60 family protein [Luedemannella helvata]|uniref:C40 family peptidase n=1 Tax=Luedemannella helvata TaxID=349315 RepID=A0ABN2KGQ3_9ACTN
MATPARVHRPLRVALVAAVTAVSVVLTAGAQAHAADPSVSEVEKQIADLWADAEPMIEHYNKVHEQYKKNKAKLAALKKKIEPLERQVDLAQIRIGVVSAQIYKGGQASAINAMLASGEPRDLADQLSLLDQLAREQQRQISGVTELKNKYDKQRAPLDTLVAKLAEQDKDLLKKTHEIEDKLKDLQALRRKLYGTSGGTGSYRPWPCPSEYAPTNGYKAAKFACSQAGDPYVWAAAGPNSYDCSGLTLRSWSQVGVSLPHNAAAQRSSMKYIDKADLQIGDLVFYFSNLRHVAIYVGDGKVMHAPTAGDNVRMAEMYSVGSVHSFGRPG